jgi:hypothetical protein
MESMSTWRSFAGIVADWATRTWTSGDFWRNALLLFVGFLLPLWVARRTDRKRETAHRDRLVRIVVGGVVGNLVAIRRIREILHSGSGPALRLDAGHYEAEILSTAADVLSDEEYESLLNARLVVDHFNRRLDFLEGLERTNLDVELRQGTSRQINVQPYLVELCGTGNNEGLTKKLERILETTLRALDQAKLKEVNEKTSTWGP